MTLLVLVKLGFENVQSLYGTNGFTDEHLQILKDDRVKTVILALDNDEAGKNASEKLKAKLIDEGFTVKVISPPCKDWNEYLCTGTASGGHASADEIREQIKTAEIFKASTTGTNVNPDTLRLTQDGIYYNAVSGNVKLPHKRSKRNLCR